MKEEIRRAALARRDGLSNEERHEKSKIILKRVLELDEFRQANTVMTYVNFGSEVETRGLIEESIASGKRVVVPITDFEKHNLKLVLFKNFRELAWNRFGIPEPPLETGRSVKREELDLVIVPGIAFDEKGNRIGFGKAFYDKFLNSPGKRVRLVALAFEIQVLKEAPVEKHDVRMDIVVTEERVIVC